MTRDTLERNQVWVYLAAILVGFALGAAMPALGPAMEALLWPCLAALLYATFTQVPLAHLPDAFRDMRFMSAVLAGRSPCGRTNTRIKGWMGRADQTTKVRAMFVTPTQVQEVLRRHKEVLKARLVVAGETGDDRMTLRCEVNEGPAGLVEAIVASIRDVTKLRGDVELVAPGTLPNDGKVIDDTRKYS